MQTNQIEAMKIWQDRDALVEGKIEAYTIADVLDRYDAVHEMREQVDLLGNLAEAVEAGADALYFETVTSAFDPRTHTPQSAKPRTLTLDQCREFQATRPASTTDFQANTWDTASLFYLE